ncbi:hypothetical protein RB531_5338 [Salmonella enterica subsp. enterica serovar Typhimurium]
MVRCMFSQTPGCTAKPTTNPEEGTVDLEFHGEEDFTSDKRTCAQKADYGA